MSFLDGVVTPRISDHSVVEGSTPPDPSGATPPRLGGGIRNDLTPNPPRSNRGQAFLKKRASGRTSKSHLIPTRAWIGELVGFGLSCVDFIRGCLDPRLRGEDARNSLVEVYYEIK